MWIHDEVGLLLNITRQYKVSQVRENGKCDTQNICPHVEKSQVF